MTGSLEEKGVSEVLYTVSPLPVVKERPAVIWQSCCFSLDKAFVTYAVQSVVGTCLLGFSAYRLTTEPDCDRAAPYWGLIGTMCGFFFRKVATSATSGLGSKSAGGDVV